MPPFFDLISHPIVILAFFTLIMAFISLWVYKHFYLFGSFVTLSCFLAYFAKLIDPIALIAIGLLAICYVIISKELKIKYRIFLLLLIFIISILLMTHTFPGFHNFKLLDSVLISSQGHPWTFYLNFDKPFIGFFALAFTIPLLPFRSMTKKMMLKIGSLTFLGVGILLFFAFFFKGINVDIKFPAVSLIFLISNLFLTTIPEEAFFRGILQRELSQILNIRFSKSLSVLLISFLFALSHLIYLRDLSYIFLTFIAGLIYGTLYELTKSIESSIICHYLVNVIHWFFFTFPI